MDNVFTARRSKEEVLKKIVSLFLVLICFFAFMLNLSGNDPDNDWNFRSYCEYVTENVEPFPTATLSFTYDEDASEWQIIVNFFSWIGDLIAYPFEFLGVVLNNIGVLFDGFFPVNWAESAGGSYPGQTGSSGESGSFGGGGFGGGAGGAR